MGSARASLVSRLELVLTAALFVLLLAAALMTLVIAPNVRQAIAESGRPLPWALKVATSAGFWPSALAALVLATFLALTAHAPWARRLALAAGLALGLSGLVGYGGLVLGELELREVFGQGNPLERKPERRPPRALEPGP